MKQVYIQKTYRDPSTNGIPKEVRSFHKLYLGNYQGGDP